MEYFTRSEKGVIEPVTNPDPFTYKTIKLFSHKEGDEFKVTEVSTGCLIASSMKSKAHSIEVAQMLIDKFSPAGIKRSIDHALRTYNPPPPKLQSNAAEV